MPDHNDQLNQLLHRLDSLAKKQEDFSREIQQLRADIAHLQATEAKPPVVEKVVEQKAVAPVATPTSVDNPFAAPKKQAVHNPFDPFSRPPKKESNLEKFIGENLINKIGIGITVIGVAIGTKYAIDHNLISPLTRIILGYLFSIGLLVVAFVLKKKYESFSAVLLSGAMASLYFITYSAYSFYELIPQAMAFVLMVVFTMFTVVAAIQYNQQVIALFGLVGAYGVPFLLSDGSGRVGILFSYMAILNVGVLAVGFKKYWKSVYISSFVLTWLVYEAWYFFKYYTSEYFSVALTFLFVFFILFYLTFLTHKVFQKIKFEKSDIVLLLLNSFIFYAIGYSLLSYHPIGKNLLGLFTVCNALLHFMVSVFLYRQSLVDKTIFYFVAGLVLTFITLAIPVQLDGHSVTLLWVGEAALLFWIGRTKQVPMYESLAYPLMGLAFFSLLQDWSSAYDVYLISPMSGHFTPLFNIHFLTSLLFILSFGYIVFLHHRVPRSASSFFHQSLASAAMVLAPIALLAVLYFSFYLEIAHHYDQQYADSLITINAEGQDYPTTYQDSDLKLYKTLWLFHYTLFFVAVLSFLNLKKIQNKTLGDVSFALSLFAVGAFLLFGLYALSDLRDSYLAQTLANYYPRTMANVLVRYLSLCFVALPLVVAYLNIRQEAVKLETKIVYELALVISILWIASSELIHWMSLGGYTDLYKLGLSILWGVYSLLLISFGLWKRKKHIRLSAIILFGITLVKLFLYDISQLSTIAKTIVFVSLGILLLIISFLYNKYKHIITHHENPS